MSKLLRTLIFKPNNLKDMNSKQHLKMAGN